MQQELFFETDIKPIIGDYIEHFVNIIHESFDFYISTTPILGTQKIRTRCDIIRSKAISLFADKYFNNSDVEIIENDDDTFALIISQKIILRFKKLNRTKKANFNRTSRSKNFIKQLDFDGFLSNSMNLILGYLPDQTWSKLMGVYIAHPQGKFAYDLEEVFDEKIQVETTSINTIDMFDKDIQQKPTIRIKKRKKANKNGTESNKS